MFMSRGVSFFGNVQRCAGIMQVIWLGVVLLLCFAMMHWFLEDASWVRSIAFTGACTRVMVHVGLGWQQLGG